MKYFLPWNMRDFVVDENEKVLTAGKAVAAVVIVDSSNSNGEKRKPRSTTMTHDVDVPLKLEKYILAAKN